MRGHAVLMSTGNDDWVSPPALFNALDAEFAFNLDAAADADNAQCAEWLGPGSAYPDALVVDWSVEFPWLRAAWINPPYSRGLQPRFIAKAAAERLKGVTTVMLLPARTDTAVFHRHVWNRYEHTPKDGVEVRFLRGRLTFVGAPSSAPFPSMVVVFRGAT